MEGSEIKDNRFRISKIENSLSGLNNLNLEKPIKEIELEYVDLLKHLKILGGSFAIINRNDKNILLLENKELEKKIFNEDSEINDKLWDYIAEIPYQIQDDKNECKRNFIDFSFIGFRNNQPLEYKKGDSGEVVGPPEFIFHLYDDDFKSKFLNPFNKKRIHKNNEVLHITNQEVILWLLLWLFSSNEQINNIKKEIVGSSENYKRIFPKCDFSEKNIPTEEKDVVKILGIDKEFLDYLNNLCNQNRLKINFSSIDELNVKKIGQLLKLIKIDLNNISKYAGFPLLPYYIIKIFTEGAHLEHWVLPLWNEFVTDDNFKTKVEAYRDEPVILDKHKKYIDKNVAVGYALLTTTSNSDVDIFQIRYIMNILVKPAIDRVFYGLVRNKDLKKILEKSVKSAIAAIMSRNGSHNIGSHVLAALTHELSDVTDNQKLFQYIQQRMDFIAQITTEIPDWTYPAYFVQDIMRGFYIQRHLLNKIAESEDLKAYEFQPRKSDIVQKNKIVIKIKYNDKWIISNENDNQDNELETYVQVAIPGGVVGYHAIYTVLENFIRNSAKHGWSKENNKDNLEITIEIKDSNKNDSVEFTIYDNIPVNYNENLVQEQNKKLAKPFIEPTGSLRYENWGLAEMKIAVGYLNKMDFKEIGEEKAAGEERKNTNQIYAAWKEGSNGEKFLSYKFAIPKPKIVALIGFSEEEFVISKGNGIYFLEKNTKDKDYDFILIKSSEHEKLETEIKEKASYPIRTMCYDKNIKDERKIEELNNKYIRIKLITKKEFNELQKINSYENFIKKIYELWITHKYNKKNNEKWFLHVQPFENKSGSQEVDVKTKILEKIKKEEDWIERRLNKNEQNNRILDISEIEKMLDNIFPYLKSNFYKYEEDIETLPKVFRASNAEKNKGYEKEDKNDRLQISSNSDIFTIEEYTPESDTDTAKYFVYKRHLSDIRNAFLNYSYAEALSGAQFYFPLYSLLLKKEKNGRSYKKDIFLLQLLENALFQKIIIMDERFFNFYKRNNENVFDALGIIPIEELIYSSPNDSEKKSIVFGENTTENKLVANLYELAEIKEMPIAVIIHQTILDNNFNSDSNKIKEFVSDLNKLVSYVVITSGRGKPDKLPPNAYFLPFSTMEALLLKQYPEKLLFTNILHRLYRSQ